MKIPKKGDRYAAQAIKLAYPGKTEAPEIIAGAEPAALRRTKIFGEVGEGEWHNMIIFGDNIAALKTLLEMKEKGMKNADGSSGVKLIYIDPPFGTGDVYGRGDVGAYSAKLTGARYLEWLRRRIILLRELLCDSGSFYMRIDYHFGHYMKVLLDEIFGAAQFRNEIVISRTKKIFEGASRFNAATDSVFFYTKSDKYTFNGFKKKRKAQKWIAMHSPGIRWTEIDEAHLAFYKPGERVERKGRHFSRGRIFDGKVLFPPEGRHWTFTQERMDKYLAEGRIRLNLKGVLEYLTSAMEIVDSNWTDIPGYTFKWNYPTENSEQLLERIISASSDQGDVVLDAFAGAGTTGAVAEKLKRNWILMDSSKFSIHTIVSRMLNLKEHIGNGGKALAAKPFALYDLSSKEGAPMATDPHQTGFDVVYPPDVECCFYIERRRGKLSDEFVIKIMEFHSNAFSEEFIKGKEGGKRRHGMEALSSVMMDCGYDGECFKMRGRWEAKELEKNGYEIRIGAESAGKRMMVVFSDIYGNELKEIKTREDFERGHRLEGGAI